MPDWNSETTVAVMDRQDIATAMLSVSSPGVYFGDSAAARRLARSVNEFAVQKAQDYPGRYGTFASLPLPDIDAALEEIDYALRVLKVDGFVMLTNFGGTYLGDAKFDPIFDELNRRQAVIFIHPTSPPCWEHIALGYPRPMIEFPFESTRAVTNLVISGTLDRYPKFTDYRAARRRDGAVLGAPYLGSNPANESGRSRRPEGRVHRRVATPFLRHCRSVG